MLRYLCLGESTEESEFFLIVGRELLTQRRARPDHQAFSFHKSETPRWPTSEILNFHVGGYFFSLQPDLHGGYTAASRSLCVHPVFKTVFKLRPPAVITSESFRGLFAPSQFLTLLSPPSHHRLIYPKMTCSSSISVFNRQIYCL